jgi:hypothetical protein
MANLIQASVYQIDGSPLPEAITLDFQTSNLVIREASIVGTSAVNSAILYYNLPNNQLSVQTFYVGESIAELVAAANVGSTTQLQATVLEINKDPQVPGGVQYSFPANEIVIGENIDYALPDVKSYIQFKGIRYSVFEAQADLLVSGNGASAYKVYTALLTQSGGDDPQSIDSGLLTIGVTYMINNPSVESDFTNVGAPNNLSGTYFVATGTTPNNWGTDTNILTYNTGAPVVTVLENTIGNIWWTYDSVGKYIANSTNAFTNGGTWQLIENSGAGGGVISSILYVNSNVIWVYSFDGGTQSDDILSNTPIEIRVYN